MTPHNILLHSRDGPRSSPDAVRNAHRQARMGISSDRDGAPLGKVLRRPGPDLRTGLEHRRL